MVGPFNSLATVDHVPESLAALEGENLTGNLPRQGVRVGNRRNVRGDEEVGQIPKRTFGRQGFGLEYVEARAGQGAVRDGRGDVRLHLAPATAGVDQDRSAERPIAAQLSQASHIDQVGRLRCERQECNQDIGACQKCIKASSAAERLDVLQLLPRPAPASDLES
jgi:hypothetical protein